MRLLLHIVGKDLRRLRWWAAGWLLLQSLPIGLALLVARLPADADWKTFETTNAAVIGLQAFLAFLITLMLMQEDRAMGTRQFWATRPISGWRLLGAKLIAALAVVAGGAVLVALPWWLFCGYGLGDIARGSLELGLAALVVVLPAMFAAAVTDSLARALLWSVVLLGVFWATGFALPAFMAENTPRTAAVLISRATLIVIVTLLLAATGVALLYGARLRGRRLVIPGVVAVVCLWASGNMRWAWIARSEPTERDAARAKDFQVTFHSADSVPPEIYDPRQNRGDDSVKNDRLRLFFVASRPPDGWGIETLGMEHRWSWKGVQLKREGWLNWQGEVRPDLFGFEWAPPDPETVAWNKAEQKRAQEERLRRGIVRRNVNSTLPKSPTAPANRFTVEGDAWVPSSLAVRMAADAPAYDGRLWFAYVRPSIVNEMPLKEGAWTSGKGHSSRISGSQRDASGLALALLSTEPYSWVAEIRRAAERRTWFRHPHGLEHVLLNRTRNEFITGRSDDGFALYVAGVRVRYQAFQVSSYSLMVRRGEQWVERPGWLAEASLATIRQEREVVFSRNVHVDALPVKRLSPQ